MRAAILGAALAALAALVPGASADAPKEPSARGDALELLALTGDRPARVELRVTIGGKSVPALWDEAFAALHAFFDRDASGALDKAEAARLPSAFALRQVLWGQVAPFTGAPPEFAQLDLNGDGSVSVAELSDFYRRAGLGNVLVGVGKPGATDRITDALLNALDANKDGTVDAAEWKAAPTALRKLDANDDELIGPGELVERVAYPGALGANLLLAPHAGAKPDALADNFPLAVLPLRAADTEWAAALAERLKTDKAHLLAARGAKPAAEWHARFGTGAPVLEGGTKPSGALRLQLRADAGKLADQTAAARKRYFALFAEADASADGALDANELDAPKAALLKPVASAADRNTDGTLSAAEFGAWWDLCARVADAHVLLTVLDHGTGLFELLDADRDGSLSVRELRGAWDRLTAEGCAPNGAFARAELPRQLYATVSRGHPVAALGAPPRAGPEWFRASDRNGDGDVSRREFTGPAEVFDKLDADADGLLSAEEAQKAVPPK
jgi:EF hand